jgi:hypothetical protein
MLLDAPAHGRRSKAIAHGLPFPPHAPSVAAADQAGAASRRAGSGGTAVVDASSPVQLLVFKKQSPP